MITAHDLQVLMTGLDHIGRTEHGFRRLAWTPEDEEAGTWFAEQAAEIGLTVERDAAGNRWACPDAPPPWWGIGSHLDTVAGGGRYDGALGVACGFAVAQAVDAPVAVISFQDEEGARFNTPTFGSRALVGRLELHDVLARADIEDVTLARAMSACGVDPGGLAQAPAALRRLRGFLEIHIDQSRELAEAGAPAGAVTRLAGRLRLAVELEGEADHAGTTRRSERRDALAAAARLIVLAEDLAAPHESFVVTPTRILAEPNALSTIPGRVRLWLDARAPEIETVDTWRAELEREAAALGQDRRVEIRLTTASRSPGVAFDLKVPTDGPEVVCFAGHDAGVLAERIPAGMVLVRNRTGVSHSPAESIDLEDAAVAANAVAAELERRA